MGHIPRSPFSIRLSGSAREVELRIQNIVQGPKRRPPILLLVLTAAAILLCGGLVSCQPREAINSDPLISLTLDDGGSFYLKEEAPRPAQQPQSDTVGVLYYQSPQGALQEVAALDYGPGHHYWDSVSLEPFTDVLGRGGAVLGYSSGMAWYNMDYYAADGTASLLASCHNSVWQEDVDGDGQPELLSNYHTMGYLDLYQRGPDGQVQSFQLNSAAPAFLPGLPEDAWVGLAAGGGPGLLDASWTGEDGRLCHRMLEAAALLAFEQNYGEVYKYPITTADGRSLTLVLWGRKLGPEEWNSLTSVDRILVYEGEALLQTIDPATIAHDGSYAYKGLFIDKGGSIGEPDIRDLNFDGSEDFGMLCVGSYNYNVPYCYFLWDGEAAQFSLSFVLFAPLKIDQEAQELVESSHDGGIILSQYDHYAYDGEGRLQLVRRECIYPIQDPPDGQIRVNPPHGQTWVDLYEMADGELIHTGQELRPERWPMDQSWYGN